MELLGRTRRERRAVELARRAGRSPITMPGYRKGRPAPNKGMKLPAEILTPAEVSALLRACSTRGSAGIRDRALFVLMWRSGLRIAEALALRPSDIDLEQGTVTVLHGKGNRRRTVGLDPQACAVIERWITRRRELGVPRTWHGQPAPLFCLITTPKRGKPLHSAQVREKLKDVAARAGIEKRVHPHGLRHTCAFDVHHRERLSAQVVQRQLGHNSLDTTARYLNHLAPAELITMMQARRWPGEVHAADPRGEPEGRTVA